MGPKFSGARAAMAGSCAPRSLDASLASCVDSLVLSPQAELEPPAKACFGQTGIWKNMHIVIFL